MSATRAARGRILSTSRRLVSFLREESPSSRGGSTEPLRGIVSSKALAATIGDLVLFEERGGEFVITEILPPKNRLVRSYRDEARPLAHNVDHVFIVTAVQPLFNTDFIDRVMVVCHEQRIPCSLIVNKIDLETKSTESLIDVYRSLKVPIIETSARRGDGMEELRECLSDARLDMVVLTGVSGVGKSSLLNLLAPHNTPQRTADVSWKTGQGKQTTTAPEAHQLKRSEIHGKAAHKDGVLLLIDLPGIQQFGVTHLSKEEIVEGFPEFTSLEIRCPFDNCSHISEDECAVRRAVEEGLISPTRFLSYVRMMEEKEQARPRYGSGKGKRDP